MWGDPPPAADDVELSVWVAEALGGERAILDLLRDVAAGDLRPGPLSQLARELGEDGEPIDLWLLTEGLVIAGHDRLAHDLRRRLGLITRRGKRVQR